MSLLNLISEGGFRSCNRFQIYPDISDKFIERSRSAFGYKDSVDDIVAFIDGTVFKTGKDGCIVCSDRLIFKRPFETPVEYMISEIESIHCSGSKVFINGMKASDFDMLDAEVVQDFFNIIESWVNDGVINDKPKNSNLSKSNKLFSEKLGFLCSQLKLDGVFPAPGIPKEKVASALKVHDLGIQGKDVLLLVDDTLLGGGRDGLIITDTLIAAKEIMQAPRFFYWDEVEEISIKKKTVYCNGRPLVKLTIVDENSVGWFFSALNQALSLSRSGLDSVDVLSNVSFLNEKVVPRNIIKKEDCQPSDIAENPISDSDVSLSGLIWGAIVVLFALLLVWDEVGIKNILVFSFFVTICAAVLAISRIGKKRWRDLAAPIGVVILLNPWTLLGLDDQGYGALSKKFWGMFSSGPDYELLVAEADSMAAQARREFNQGDYQKGISMLSGATISASLANDIELTEKLLEDLIRADKKR